LPIFNWWKLSEGDLTYLKKKRRWVRKNTLKKLATKLQQDFFDTFGVSDEFNKLFEDRKELLILECDRKITGNKFLGTRINLLKIRINETEKKKNDNDIYKVKSFIDKYVHGFVDVKKMSVREFYVYLEVIKAENGKD